MSDLNCIFCSIVNHDVPTKFIDEATEVFVICDIAPRAKTHLLIIPKKHICNMKNIDIKTDVKLCQEMFHMVAKVALRLKGAQAFKLLCNNEREAGQEVMHLHWHFLSDEELGQ